MHDIMHIFKVYFILSAIYRHYYLIYHVSTNVKRDRQEESDNNEKNVFVLKISLLYFHVRRI